MPSSSAAICAIAVLRAGADVLHRRDDRRAAVGADADPGVARRAAAAVPDLRRHPDAALDGVGRALAHLVAALPVRLGAAVALEQLLAAVRTLVGVVLIGVVLAAQLERVEVELGRELVEQRLEPERPFDEPGCAERLHRRLVDLRRRTSSCSRSRTRRASASVLRSRTTSRAQPTALTNSPPSAVSVPSLLRADRQPLDRRVAVAGRDVLLAPGQRALDGPAGSLRELGRDERVVVGRRSSSRSRRP